MLSPARLAWTCAGLVGAFLGVVTGCQGILGIDEFSETDSPVSGDTGAGSEDGAGGGSGGAGGEVPSGLGGSPVPQLTWGAVLSGAGQSEVGGLAVDANGNVTVCGSFKGQLRLGATTVSSSGPEDADVYVARMPGRMKSDAPGAEEPDYVRQFGDAAQQGCAGVALANDGSTWITGALEGSVSFDGDTLDGSGPRRAFAALLAADGSARAFELGGTGLQDGRAIAAYEDGSALMVGQFTQRLDADGQSLQTGDATAGFAARVDGAPAPWVYGVGIAAPADLTDDEVRDGVLTTQQDAIVVGTHSADATTTSGTTLDAFGGIDFFVAKLDAGGAEQWAVGGGSVHEDAATAVTVDGQGGIIVVGSFRENLTIGSGAQSWPGHGPDDSDAFVAKLAEDGEVTWVQTIGGSGDARAWDVALDGFDNIYVVGSFHGEITFADESIGSADGDGFFVVLDPQGEEIIHQAITGPDAVAARSVVANPATGGVVIGVQFADSVDMMARSFQGDPNGTNVCLARVDWLP